MRIIKCPSLLTVNKDSLVTGLMRVGYCLFFLSVLLLSGQGVTTSLVQPEGKSSLPEVLLSDTASNPSASTSVSISSALPQYVIANNGQVDTQFRDYTRGNGQSMYFSSEGVHFVLRVVEENAQTAAGVKKPGEQRDVHPETFKLQSTRLSFIGANPDPVIEAEEPLAGRVNYLIGNDADKWYRNIPTYGVVVYRELYPGVDVRFYEKLGTLEYDVIVAPGADPKQVRFRYEGADNLELNESGDLVIALGKGELIQRRPVVYQDIDGRRTEVEAAFALEPGDGTAYSATVGFQLAGYDRGEPLVIDPVLNFSTYLGGSGGDYGFGVAVDGAGRIIVVGYTWSEDLPLAGSPYQTSLGGNWDAFVARLSADGSAVEDGTKHISYPTIELMS